MSSGMLLTFESVTNPITLLESLIVQRNMDGYLFIREENFKACNDQGMHEYEDDLRDPKFIDYLDGWITNEAGIRSKNDLTLDMSNIILCLQILQFALKEGYIKVYEKGSHSNYDDEILRLNNNKKLYDNIFTTFDYGRWTLTSDWAIKGSGRKNIIADINASINLNHGLVLGHRPNNIEDKISNIFTTKNHTFREVIKDLEFSKFKDIQMLIDNPKIFKSVSDSTIELYEKRNLKEDLLLLLPRILIGNLTLGINSVIELFWKYHKFNKK